MSARVYIVHTMHHASASARRTGNYHTNQIEVSKLLANTPSSVFDFDTLRRTMFLSVVDLGAPGAPRPLEAGQRWR